MSNAPLDQAEAELDSWMARAYEAEKRAWRAEKRLAAWMEHWNATARTGAVDEVAAILEANTRADQAEARVRHLETTAQVLVKEALDAETLRDEHRRGRAEAEARIKAVQDVLDQPADDTEGVDSTTALYARGYDLALFDVRRALESDPPPGQ